MKALFWYCAQVNVPFADGPSNVRDSAVALSTVTINFFLVRAIQQWMLFLVQHWITDVVSEHLLHRQVSRAQENVESRLEITLADAHVFQQSYFPQAHTYGSADTATSLLLLERAI